jgi:hypothetical protein
LIGYLGCMFVLLIGPTGFGCAMTISCVKGAVLVDWVQGFCCVRKEGRAKGPCLHCFVAGDVHSGSRKVRLSGGHLTNFVTHERSRSLNHCLNHCLNTTPHRTLFTCDMYLRVSIIRLETSLVIHPKTQIASISIDRSRSIDLDRSIDESKFENEMK